MKFTERVTEAAVAEVRAARRRSSVLLSLLTMSRVFTVLKAVCLTPDTNGRSLISCQKPKTGSDIRSSRSSREFPGRSRRAAREPEHAPLYEESDPLVGSGRRVCRRALHCSGLWPMRLTLAEAKSASG